MRNPPSAYVLNPLAGPIWVRGVVRITGDQISLTSHYEYAVVQSEDERAAENPPSGLVFEFAAIENERDARRFAQRWGLLTCGPRAEHYEEDLSEWYRAANYCREILRIYYALKTATASRDPARQAILREITEARMQRMREQDEGAASFLESRGLERTAAFFITEYLNAALSSVVMAVYPWGFADIGDDPVVMGEAELFRWSPNFTALIGYIYFRLAQTIVETVPIFQCEHCGHIRQRGRGKGSGNRRFCDESCAQAGRDRRYQATH